MVNQLIQTAEDEWEFFGRAYMNLDGTSTEGKKEFEDIQSKRIADYWKFIGGQYAGLTGKHRKTPWSAAFISFCMNQAGAKKQFPYSASHAKYINTAIKNSDDKVQNATLYAHKPAAYKLKIGDLICYWRGDKPITMETARKIGYYESHSEIITQIHDGRAYSISGNVDDTVMRREVELNAAGQLTDKSENWFVVLENKITFAPALVG